MWHSHPGPSEIIALVDFENAYNTLDRQAMITTVCEEAPPFARYAAFCYGAPTPLFGSGFCFMSEEGTEQGDVCGPLFFSKTLQRVLRKTCHDSPGLWSRAYLDDVTLCGKQERVLASLADLCSESATIGLKASLSKCRLRGPELPETHPSGIPVVPWSAGLKILGTPVGSPKFVAEFVADVSERLQDCLDRLSLLGDSFASFHILRSCLSACKVNHLLRSLPFEQGTPLAASSKDQLVESLSSLVVSPLSPS